jgi:hypothetical protein
MKIIKEVIRDIEHIPKCPRSGEINFYYYIVNPIKQKNMSYIKFYDNGVSIEIGTPVNDKSILCFDSKVDIDEESLITVNISKKDVQELILFLQNKVEDMT